MKLAALVALAVGHQAVVQEAKALSHRPSPSFLGIRDEVLEGNGGLTLQERMDQACTLHFEALCKEGVEGLCGNIAAVARKDITSTEREMKWRCYAATAMDNKVSRAHCVDDCGSEAPCLGSYKGGHSSTWAGLADAKADALKITCPATTPEPEPEVPLQPEGPTTPETEGPTTPEPEGPTTPETEGPTTPETEGPTTPEPEGPTTPEPEGPTTPETEGPTTPETEGPTTPETEGPTTPETEGPGTSPESGGGSTPGVPSPDPSLPAPSADVSRLRFGGSVQHNLNGGCIKLFALECKKGSSVNFCQAAVARKASGGAWECYGENAMEAEEEGALCTDDCGKAIPCYGKPRAEGALPLANAQEFIRALVGRACPKPQAAAQAVCDQEEGGVHLARKHADGWGCFKADELIYEKHGVCWSPCAEQNASCVGGVDAAGSGLSRNDEIVSAATAVMLCKEGQTCKAVAGDSVAYCVAGEQLVSGMVGHAKLTGLTSKFVVALGTCLEIVIDPKPADSTARLSIIYGEEKGGFLVAKQDGSYGISLARENQKLVVMIKHGESQAVTKYTVPEPDTCKGVTDFRVRTVPKETSLVVSVNADSTV